MSKIAFIRTFEMFRNLILASFALLLFLPYVILLFLGVAVVAFFSVFRPENKAAEWGKLCSWEDEDFYLFQKMQADISTASLGKERLRIGYEK